MKQLGGEPRHTTKLWHNLVLLGFSVGLALVAGEIAARLILPGPVPWLYPQILYRTDPELVFTLAPDQVAFTADKPVRINSRKLRGPLFEFTPRPGYIRLLWLGDSIVFGFGVTDEEVVTRRVEDRLERRGVRTESINTAVPAYNTEQEVTFMALDGIRYHPDWVIVGFCWNDINDQLGARICPNGWLVSTTAGEGNGEPSFLESSKGYAIRNALKRSRLVYGVMEGVRALH